ncbi:hypothetical protein [Atopobium sp. oral taxon 416]|nr:hypothetical protein [Atopobium sp. oral taxon 416]QUC02018.1 hypothetical protein J4859_08020 [Atopobium sp. oral taxon 416]
MTSAQQALVKQPEVPAVPDTAQLGEVISIAESLVETDYTPASGHVRKVV